MRSNKAKSPFSHYNVNTSPLLYILIMCRLGCVLHLTPDWKSSWQRSDWQAAFTAGEFQIRALKHRWGPSQLNSGDTKAPENMHHLQFVFLGDTPTGKSSVLLLIVETSGNNQTLLIPVGKFFFFSSRERPAATDQYASMPIQPLIDLVGVWCVTSYHN